VRSLVMFHPLFLFLFGFGYREQPLCAPPRSCTMLECFPLSASRNFQVDATPPSVTILNTSIAFTPGSTSATLTAAFQADDGQGLRDPKDPLQFVPGWHFPPLPGRSTTAQQASQASGGLWYPSISPGAGPGCRGMSPAVYRRLTTGEFVLSVVALDRAGNTNVGPTATRVSIQRSAKRVTALWAAWRGVQPAWQCGSSPDRGWG